ncbi:MAG: hypothetical protein GY842_13260 [bacterium]|nr:hypothetical protein [bacterium]
MAAARAQAKGGVSGIHIWLIVFVALWLTSTVLLVLLYTDQKDLVSRNEDLRRDLDANQANLSDARDIQQGITEVAVGSADTTLQQVRERLGELSTRIAGDQRVPEAAAFADASYHDALSLLYDAFSAQADLREQADARNRELGDETAALGAANEQLKTDYDGRIAEQSRRLDELADASEEYAKARDREVDTFEQKLENVYTEANRDIQEMRDRIRRLTGEFDDLQSRYTELKDRLGELQIRPQELITARQADGQVVTAKPGEGVVYIDLGRDAGLVLGLQFAVYNGSAGIPADGKSKARIEVVNIFDQAAECRVVEVHGRMPILEGDWVANPVFDSEQALQFMVVGRFDVDGDGEFDGQGAGHIESLVDQWGGERVDELSARVDFLVLGDAPPKPITIGDPTPEAAARYAAAERVRNEYDETLRAAQALSIPILTQNVFMHFLGYAG